MIELVYVSRAINRYNEDELFSLLKTCRRNNEKLGVTGLLLYDNLGTFIQVLEGSASIVENLFDKIKQDPRHNHVHLLGRHAITKTSFPDWHMGFHLLDKKLIQGIEGYKNLSDENLLKATQQQPSFAYHLLSYFKDKVNHEHL